MKIFNKCILFIPIVLIVTSCTMQPTKLIKEKEIEYVGIPVPCEVPEVICDFSGEWLEPTEKLIRCISEQKKVIEICSGKLPDADDVFKATYQDLGSITIEEEIDANITK